MCILLMHELNSFKASPNTWMGKLSHMGENILTQHNAQIGLVSANKALVRWTVYSQIHPDHPLAFELFVGLLDKLTWALQSNIFGEDEVKIFWNGAKNLLPSCFAVIRNLLKMEASEQNFVKMLTVVLGVMVKLTNISPPKGFDMLPKSKGGSRMESHVKDGIYSNLHLAVKDAVISGVEDWFTDLSKKEGPIDDQAKLQHIIDLIQLTCSDLQRTIDYYDTIFLDTIQFQFAQTLYSAFELKLTEIAQPAVKDVIKFLATRS